MLKAHNSALGPIEPLGTFVQGIMVFVSGVGGWLVAVNETV